MGIGMSIKRVLGAQTSVYRILTYNVEWGFLKLPSGINKDSCGHPIPQTSEAQQEHLLLISKNIGLINPDICFLQEMGSLDAVKNISNNLSLLFNLDYTSYYSNTSTGYQGVGLLIKSNLIPFCEVSKIPNFLFNRALGITIEKKYKIVGVHLKSLYDQDPKKDIPEQLSQLAAVQDWVKDTSAVIICGDFNNVPESAPIQKMKEYGYKNILDSDAYVQNITDSKDTEFHGKNGKESGSEIDYIFTTSSINQISGHIVNLVRENKYTSSTERQESSDHLPVLGIFKL